MSAYWMSIHQEIFDQDKVNAYARLARPALEAAGGTFVARGLSDQTYEAGETTRTVLIVFDFVETAAPPTTAPPTKKLSPHSTAVRGATCASCPRSDFSTDCPETDAMPDS